MKKNSAVAKRIVQPEDSISFRDNNIINDQKEDNSVYSKKHLPGKLKVKKKNESEYTGMLNKKVKILVVDIIRFDSKQSKILPADKEVVRQNILNFIVQVPPLLRAQLCECLKTIIHSDYPEQWPTLLHRVKHNLQDNQVYGALFVLRILSRKYEFKSDEERTPVHHIVEETFPHLLNIFNRLVQIVNPSVEVALSNQANLQNILVIYLLGDSKAVVRSQCI